MQGHSTTTAQVSRDTVEAFYAALRLRDTDLIGRFLDEDVDWMIMGPVDLLPYCGPRHGKDAVIATFGQISDEMRVTGLVQEYLLADGDRAASLSRLTAIHRDSGNVISYRVSHFMRFRDQKIVEFRSLIDTLDVTEQILGHEVDRTPAQRLAVV